MLNKRFEVKLIEKDSSEGNRYISMEVYHKEKLIGSTYFYKVYKDEEYIEEMYFNVHRLEVQQVEDRVVFGLKGKIKVDHEEESRLETINIPIPYDDITKEEYVTLRDTIFKLSRAAELNDYLFNKEKLNDKEFEKFTINNGLVYIYLNEELGLNEYKNYTKTVEKSVSNILSEKGRVTDRYVKISNLNDYEFKKIVLALDNTKFEFNTKTATL